jgi:hypothetical protein
MQKPDSVRCDKCTFYNGGNCQRYPPQHVPLEGINLNLNNNGSTLHGQLQIYTTPKWPWVSQTDFCGEFVPSDNLTAVEWVAWKKGLLEDGKIS